MSRVLPGEVSGIAGQHVTQGGAALVLGVVVADQVGLGQVFDLGGFH